MNFRTALAASAIFVATFFVVAVGTAIVLSKGFGVDDTLAGAIGFGAFLLLQFFVRRHLKKQDTQVTLLGLPQTNSTPVAPSGPPTTPYQNTTQGAWFTINERGFYGDGNWLAYPADLSSGRILGPPVGRIHLDVQSGVYSIIDAQGRAYIASRVQ